MAKSQLEKAEHQHTKTSLYMELQRQWLKGVG